MSGIFTKVDEMGFIYAMHVTQHILRENFRCAFIFSLPH